MTRDKPCTISQCFEEYTSELRYCSHLQPETIRGYNAVFELFIKLVPEATELSLLNTQMAVVFFKRLETRTRIVGTDSVRTGVRSSTVKTYWSKLSGFFEWLTKKGYIEANPLIHIKPPQPVYEDSKALTDGEIRTLYSTITLHSANALMLRRDTAMVSLLFFCGLRFGEFISLEVRDLDFEKRLLTVRGNTSKSKKIRHVPMHPTLLLHLRDYVAERNKRQYQTTMLIVSSHADKGLGTHGLKHWVNSLRRKAGVRFHLHQFRHTFACNLGRNNVNAVVIQKLLGHGSLDMTMKYLRSMGTEDMHQEISKISI